MTGPISISIPQPRLRPGGGGGGGPVFPPTVSGTQATIAADFAGAQYWASGATKASFAAWLTAIGGTYSRSSSATYLQGGVVKTATANTPRFPTSLAGVAQGIRLTGPATNLHLQSQFAAGQYTFQGAGDTFVSNSAVAPDGTTTAAVLTPSTTVTIHNIFYGPGWNAPAGTNTITYFVFAKLTPGATCSTFSLDPTNALTFVAVFNLVTGAVASTIGAVTAGMQPLANGWYLCWVTFSVTAGNYNAIITALGNGTNGNSRNYAGDGTSGYIFWGYQITQTAFLVDYIPTTTATVTQAADSLSFPYTQTTFSALLNTINVADINSSWLLNYAPNAPILANIGPLNAGNFNNVSFLATASPGGSWNSAHKTMIAGNPTSRKIVIDAGAVAADANAFIGSAPGTMGFLVGGTQAYGNAQQLAFWNNLVASNAEMQRLTTPPPLAIADASLFADFAGNTYAVAGVSKANFAAWLAAIGGTYTRASTATYLQGGVVKTAAVNTPRFPTDAGGAPQGIRLTGSATNSVLWSTDLTNAAWLKGGNVTVATGVPDPTGGNNAQTITATATGTWGSANYVFASNTGFNGSIGTSSIWMRRRTGSGPVSLSDLNNAAQNNVSLTSTWQKFSVTATATHPSNAFEIDVLTAGDQIDVWNAQITQTAFPVDDILTSTATVTQAADNLSFPFTQRTFSALVGSGGTPYDGTGQQRVLGDDVANPPIYLSGSTVLSNWNGNSPLNVTAFNPSNPFKAMIAGGPTGRWLTANGLVPNTVADAINNTAPSILSLGSIGGSADFSYANYTQLAIWNGIIASTADMQRLTT